MPKYIYINIESTALNDQEKEILKNPLVKGVSLSFMNSSGSNMKELIASIRSIRADLVVMYDGRMMTDPNQAEGCDVLITYQSRSEILELLETMAAKTKEETNEQAPPQFDALHSLVSDLSVPIVTEVKIDSPTTMDRSKPALTVAASAHVVAENKMEMSLSTTHSESSPEVYIGLALKVTPNGLLIKSVKEKSPGQQAGLQVGDIILTFDNVAVKSREDYKRVQATMLADHSYPMIVSRNGNSISLQVTFMHHQIDVPTHNTLLVPPAARVSHAPHSPKPISVYLGLTLKKHASGLVVTSIENNNHAEKSGLQIGDVIAKLNHVDARTMEEFLNAKTDLTAHSSYPIEVLRNGQVVTCNIVPVEAKSPKNLPPKKLVAPEFSVSTRPSKMISAHLGLAMHQVGSEMAVKSLEANGPAELAGLRPSDIIKKLNFKSITSKQSFFDVLDELRVGETYPINIWREGAEITLSIIPVQAGQKTPIQATATAATIVADSQIEHEDKKPSVKACGVCTIS
ncbi:MAG: PDZ domain-containing protein [Gammaproteobacteria bacterium]